MPNVRCPLWVDSGHLLLCGNQHLLGAGVFAFGMMAERWGYTVCRRAKKRVRLGPSHQRQKCGSEPILAPVVEAQPDPAEAATSFVVCRALTYTARSFALKGRL